MIDKVLKRIGTIFKLLSGESPISPRIYILFFTYLGMNLNVMERVLALGLLPAEGDFGTLVAVSEARLKIALTPEEVTEFEYKQEGDQLLWNAEKGSTDKPIEINTQALVMMREKLKELNKDKKLTPNHVSLYKKFAEVYPELNVEQPAA